jgi:cytochrome c-type biogenesis protein CcmH
MFWIISLVILLASGMWVLWPLLSGDSRWRATGLVVLIAIPLMVYWQYQLVGSPRSLQPVEASIDPGADVSLDELVVSLREKLSESPADLEGWVLLGRSYKTLQDYPAALEALETANRLVPDEPVVLVELVEARLFASGDPDISNEMVALLEQAVSKQPGLQKGWWLLGIAAAQDGDDAQAVVYWKKLLQGIEPGSGVAQSVQAQIAEAESRLQIASGEEAPAGWTSPPITVEFSKRAAAALEALPPGSTLFLIARMPGQNSGPPLAVKRVNQPVLPLELTLNDNDSMLPQRPVSGFDSLQLQARISRGGDPMPSSGDWQSDTLEISTTQPEAATLLINQQLE